MSSETEFDMRSGSWFHALEDLLRSKFVISRDESPVTAFILDEIAYVLEIVLTFLISKSDKLSLSGSRDPRD